MEKYLVVIMAVLAMAVNVYSQDEEEGGGSKKDATRLELVTDLEAVTANRIIRKGNEDYVRADYWASSLVLEQFYTKWLALEINPQLINITPINNTDFVNLKSADAPQTMRLAVGPLFQYTDKKKTKLNGQLLFAGDYLQDWGWKNSLVLNPRVYGQYSWIEANLEAIMHLGKPREYQQIVKSSIFVYYERLIGIGPYFNLLFWKQFKESGYQTKKVWEGQVGLGLKVLKPKKKIQNEDSGLELFYVYNRYLGGTGSLRIFYAF